MTVMTDSGTAELVSVPATTGLLQLAANTTARPQTSKTEVHKLIYLLIGLAILLVSLALPAPKGMHSAAIRTLAVMCATVLWWATETFPVPITSLLIPVIVHAMGIVSFGDAVRDGLGTPLVPFTIGVLGLSAAFTASGLGKRLTYTLLAVAGTSTTRVIGVFLWLSFAISMFMDDLAVVAMLLPLALGLLRTMQARPLQSNFGKALMMAIIFGSTLGGIATPAGVSANVITAAFLAKDANLHVGFLYWMAIGVPVAALITAAAHWLIITLFRPEVRNLPYGREALRQELDDLGPANQKEMMTLLVGLTAVALWLTSDWTHIPTALVSLLILAGVCMPCFGVFRNWREFTHHIEWGAIFLLAGGFMIGTATSKSGLAGWVVQAVLARMTVLPAFVQPGVIVILTAVDSLGFASFGTTASVNVPFVIAYAQQNGLPVMLMGIAAGFASSIHFILVTQSPSIALPYSAGYFRVKDLAKLGTLVTLIGAFAIAAGIGIASLLQTLAATR